MRTFTRDLGADAVAFSGGKALRGPQASGLLLGRSDFIEAVRANGSPWERLARPMKVGKEEIAGLVRAVELYVTADHAEQAREWKAVVEAWARDLGAVPGLQVERLATNEAGQPVPRLRVAVDEAGVGASAYAIRGRLWDGDPRVLVLPDGPDAFYLTPDTLSASEAPIVSARVRAALLEQAGPAEPRGPQLDLV
jgi:L-seryl-tRNA(Ser) seleniumtransferase